MRITHISKSLIETYKHCVFAYYLKYILKLGTKSGKSAVMGNICHATLEWMAKIKQKGHAKIDPMLLLSKAWDYYTNKNPQISLRRTHSRGISADYKKCEQNIITVLEDKYYNPYNLQIVDSEIKFDIPYLNSDLKDVCQRGYIDLVHVINDDTIEIVDWKTGARKDLYTQEEKNFESLINDIQVRLYHLAAYELFMDYKNILITMYYIKEGGPITVTLDHTDISYTIASVEKFIEKVRCNDILTRNKSWLCRMCSFYNTKVCDKAWGDLREHGRDFVQQKYYGLNIEKQRNV